MSTSRILGQITGMALDTLADQSFVVNATGRWIPQAIFITNVQGISFPMANSVALAVRTAAGGGGSPVTYGYTGVKLDSTSDCQQYNLGGTIVPGQHPRTYGSTTLYAAMTTAQPAGVTGDLYLVGIDLG